MANNNNHHDPHHLEDLILGELKQNTNISDSGIWASSKGLPHDDALVGAIKRLESREQIVTSLLEKKAIALTSEGQEILKEGSAEFRVWNAVSQPLSKGDLEAKLGEAGKIGFSQAMKSQWIVFDKASGLVSRKADSVADTVRDQLRTIQENGNSDENTINLLKKRKLVQPVTLKTFSVSKGPKFDSYVEPEKQLTAEMLADGSWKEKVFKPLNCNSLGTPTSGGHFHPLLKVRAEFRQIFLDLGFEEMPTNNFVESSFWNFDALFQPQQHPARDAHDTFFLSDPAETRFMPEDYVERVKEMHSRGGHGSIGWRYDWKIEEARKNILRTHTTAVSSRMLYKLVQDGFTPKKYFSIDRVFRNEAVDRTHLAEFHQIEGLVADYNLTLGNLMGLLSQFFEKVLGSKTKLRFKPAYNPYTEPSMEIFSYHEGLKKWVEIGNTGMFRPEMLLPMGLPPDVRVIAWGLSLERPTMIKYGLSDIRDLVGHQLSLEVIEKNPVCRLDA